MINNRQGGRRRGRGGQRGPNLGGNRQDNRQRGNAAQLLEKYKNMARDAQLAGDRVQSEYYLQFADHYFRVLGESRARFEDQRRQRGEDSSDEDENESEDDIVVVCSKDRGIAEGFRLPKLDPRFASSLRKSGRGELVDGALGASGAGSCSTVGAGGSTGCAKRDYNAWAQWKRDQKKEAHAYEDAD